MRKALIGYTGFVGSNLRSQHDFTDLYNSRNFKDMRGKEYNLVVCAGVSAVKWLANKEPVKDIKKIKELEEVLETIFAEKFLLISTIDVYPITEQGDEEFDCSQYENHAYGRHRLDFEEFCKAKFSDCIIIRLPGLFGDGLKKNVIYDLLNDNCLEMINVDSSFQYYYLENLWKDIEMAFKHDIKLLNLFTEPVQTGEIHRLFFPTKSVGGEAGEAVHYDLRTKYASYWNNSDKYIYRKQQVIDQLEVFIEQYRNE